MLIRVRWLVFLVAAACMRLAWGADVTADLDGAANALAVPADLAKEPTPSASPLSGIDAPLSPALAALPASRLEVKDRLATIRTVDLTAEPDDLWQRMRNGFAMPDLVSDLVTTHQVWYLNRSSYLKTTFERARRYLYFIVEELEKRGMPTELALLPMVESSYNPMAISPARASGMWQFIPSTGKNYGLKQDWWTDQRRDIVASTGAALDYLQMLYDMQGDWQLALASYNWGEGAVARAMAKNQAAKKPVDYVHLTMPAETRNYFPKLQALKNIIQNPQLFGLLLPEIPNRPYFKVISRPADMDVSMAARLAEVPTEEFRALNPGHNRPVLRAGSGNTSLVLPADKVDTFRLNLEKADKPLLSWQNYTLGKKDSLATVAKKFGISLAELQRINGITSRTKVAPGHSILVPARDGATKISEEGGSGLTPPQEVFSPKTKPAGKTSSPKAGKAPGAKKAGKSAGKSKGKSAGKKKGKSAGKKSGAKKAAGKNKKKR